MICHNRKFITSDDDLVSKTGGQNILNSDVNFDSIKLPNWRVYCRILANVLLFILWSFGLA